MAVIEKRSRAFQILGRRKELDKAKKYLTGSYALRFDTSTNRWPTRQFAVEGFASNISMSATS
jgi:hypothetical protein